LASRLTGFHKFRHLRLNLPLVTCFEQQISGKNLSGLVIPGIAVKKVVRCQKNTILNGLEACLEEMRSARLRYICLQISEGLEQLTLAGDDVAAAAMRLRVLAWLCSDLRVR